MKLRQLFEELARTGEGKTAVVGWGRGMGHKGHMMLASSVITQANDTGADPYFVVSRTIGKDDPITPEEKLHLYKKVFPKHGHIFHTATDEMPDLNKVLTQLAQHGYTDVTVVVGADQKAAFQYLVRPDKSGVEPFKQFGLNSLQVISRQETSDPSAGEEGPRATPMRDVLKDPAKGEEDKFQTWRNAMSPEVDDDEVRDLMAKASQRMSDPTWGKKPKKEKAVAEGDVVQFPKKHKGDISNMHSCPKCGGDLQGGKYMGHQVQVCMPCKQVYLPPNSGIDHNGNKIEEGFDKEEFRRHMRDLEAREALRKTDPVSAKALDLRGQLPQATKKKQDDDSMGINDPRHPGWSYTEIGSHHHVDEIAGAFPSPSTKEKWAKDAAASNAAEARRQAELAAQAQTKRLATNTPQVDRLNKVNYSGAKAPAPSNATWDGDSDFLTIDGTQYAKASRMPITGGEAPDMKLIVTQEGWQVYTWTRNSLKGVVGRYFFPAEKPNTIQEADSDAMANVAKRLTDPNDGKVTKLRAAGDKRREEHLKSRDIAKKNEGMMDLISKTKKDVKKKAASAEEMRKYFEKEKAKDQPKHKEPGDDKNIQAVHTRHAYEDSIKYANKVIREMRAQEFTRQQLSELSVKPSTPLNKDLDQHGQGVYLARDVGGYDRVYHMNRLWMAMAMADGKTNGKIPGAATSSWSEKYNTIHPFSDADDMKIQAALKTVPSDHGHISSKDHKSREHDDVNKKSPVAKPKKNKYGI